MKRARPKQHKRRLKSGKKIIINKGIKKPRIHKQQRKIFTHLSDPKQHNVEYGGGIDFDKKGKLENINVIKGTPYSVDLPSDYEVLYHTHPDKHTSPPTPCDVMALAYNNKQQAEIIFRKGKAFTIIKTDKSRKLNRKLLEKKLKNIFYKQGGMDSDNKMKTELEKLGFLVEISNNTKKSLGVNVKPVE